VADIFQQLASAGHACGGHPAIVMVTHDQALAHKARRMVTMEDGAIIADEPLASSPDNE
jgi:predicted ABC-type transport system involved in lysophospholipase L1 biosynthesis ATPase subunit